MSCYFDKTTGFLKTYLHRSNKNTIFQFRKFTKVISLLKLGFVGALFLEILAFWVLIAYFSISWIVAIALGVFVLTTFLYFAFLFYFQTKVPSQLMDLKNRFISSCRQSLSTPKGSSEHHLSVADALLKLGLHLNGVETTYFQVRFLKKFFEKLSLFFHKEDVFKMQEQLFFSAIEEHVKQIKNTPTDVEVHVSLANSYVLLAKLYKDTKKNMRGNFQEKFQIASKRAIDEFLILKSFAPNDPWILAQLAQNYRMLGMLEEEAAEYEALLELSHDSEVMFRLGKTYFELGRNAQGLQIFEELQKGGYHRARELLFYYSATKSLEEIENL